MHLGGGVWRCNGGSTRWPLATSEHASLERTLHLAESVLEALQEHGADAVVIGAMALAVHGYPRETGDLDLAVAVAPEVLHRVAETLARRGYEVSAHDADPQDPLGGVLDVRTQGADLVQVVNFDNPPAGGFPRLVRDAVASASPAIPGRPLMVVDPYHLVAFKLYAGGPKSALDILELLDRNPEISVVRLRELCRVYRLSERLDAVLGFAGRL